MSSTGSQRGGWRLGRVVHGDFNGTLSDLVVPIKHIRYTVENSGAVIF